jgi:Trk K+ transport system NAD-binding subunit
MTKDAVTIKVLEGSPIIGKNIAEIRTSYNVDIKKVTRGQFARNPPDSVTIRENDYISFEERLNIIKDFVRIVNSK